MQTCHETEIQILKAITVALGISEDYLVKYHHAHDNQLRLLHYPRSVGRDVQNISYQIIKMPIQRSSQGSRGRKDHQDRCSFRLRIYYSTATGRCGWPRSRDSWRARAVYGSFAQTRSMPGTICKMPESMTERTTSQWCLDCERWRLHDAL